MTKTLSDLRGKCYDILREEENSTAYPYNLVDDLINTAQQKICSWLVVNPLNWMEVHKGQLPFLNKEAFYKTAPIRYVQSNLLAGSTIIPIGDISGYPVSWHVYIEWCIVSYTSVSNDSLVGCSGLILDVKAGAQVSLVYEVPADFMNPVNVIYNDKMQIYNKDYDDVFEWLRDFKGIPDYRYERFIGYGNKPFYTIKDDTYMVVYNIPQSWLNLKLRYERIPTIMVAPQDICAIPNDVYAMSVIPYLAVWETMYNRWEEQRWAEVINFWMWQLREMYQYYNKTGIERMTSKNYWMAKSKLNI